MKKSKIQEGLTFSRFVRTRGCSIRLDLRDPPQEQNLHDKLVVTMAIYSGKKDKWELVAVAVAVAAVDYGGSGAG